MEIEGTTQISIFFNHEYSRNSCIDHTNVKKSQVPAISLSLSLFQPYKVIQQPLYHPPLHPLSSSSFYTDPIINSITRYIIGPYYRWNSTVKEHENPTHYIEYSKLPLLGSRRALRSQMRHARSRNPSLTPVMAGIVNSIAS